MAQLELADLRKKLKKQSRGISAINAESVSNVNGLPSTECRTILQQISNIVYADTNSVPNLRELPQRVKAL